MAAFPTTGSNALRDARDALRIHIQKLESIIAIAADFVEALERDRLSVPTMNEAAYDAGLVPLATTLSIQLAAESSNASTAVLGRITTTLGLQ